MPPADTWEPFNPTGGELSADFRVVRTVDMEYAATRLSLDLAELSLAWKELPAPVAHAHGKVEFVSDGRSERGLGARLEGSLATIGSLRAQA